jgi:hypothetical protein
MMKIRYATLEGRPVLVSKTEAWWVIDGAWKPMHLAEASFNARLLTKERFDRAFPDLPQLPSSAFETNNEVVIPFFEVDMCASGDELYRQARSLPMSDPRIVALVERARALYAEGRSKLSPEWQAVINNADKD